MVRRISKIWPRTISTRHYPIDNRVFFRRNDNAFSYICSTVAELRKFRVVRDYYYSYR